MKTFTTPQNVLDILNSSVYCKDVIAVWPLHETNWYAVRVAETNINAPEPFYDNYMEIKDGKIHNFHN